MKFSAKSNRFKPRALAVFVSLALVLCTLLSFGFTGINKRTSADGDYDPTGTGIRFVQVAAGYDFAIGLTHNGELYGWSLLESPAAVASSSATTLGNYYPTVPSKLNFEFKVGPEKNNTWDTGTYHNKATRTDKVVQIAATRNTAAFVTESGYIYTWGRDQGDYGDGMTYHDEITVSTHNLLLRDPDSHGAWYTPYIINYYYYGTPDFGDSSRALLATEQIIPSNFSNISLAAGEYNYNFVYSKNSSYYNFVWGSLIYGVANSEMVSTTNAFILGNGGTLARNVFATGYASNDSTYAAAVAGGYTVGINSSAGMDGKSGYTTLALHGKNFLTSQGLTVNSANKKINTVATVATKAREYTLAADKGGKQNLSGAVAQAYNIGSDTYLVGGNVPETYKIGDADVIAGGLLGSHSSNQANCIVQAYPDGGNNDLYYVPIPVSSNPDTTANMSFTSSGGADYVSNAHGVTLEKYEGTTGTNSVKIVNSAVALGNDVGYAISGGAVYSWGDNKYGQSGNGTTAAFYQYPTAVSGLTSGFVSVAAGKQLSGASRAFYTGKAITASDTAFDSDFQNDSEFITGALNSDGSLHVWSNVKKAIEKLLPLGNANEYNKFVAVYSGYGNNLFAITKLGKVVRIEYDSDNSVYSQHEYDSFKTYRITDETTGAWVWEDVVNWTVDLQATTGAVGTRANNRVRFAVASNNTDYEPDLGSIVLYTDSADPTGELVTLNGSAVIAEGAPGLAYHSGTKTLIASNAIGDVYRMLDYNYDSDIAYLPDNRKLSQADIKPKFWFNGNAMTDEQQQNMFTYSIVYNDEYGVGLKIAPKQSSKSGTVTVRFYLARYDSANHFVMNDETNVELEQGKPLPSNRPAEDTANYYDYKECYINFTIDNTAAVANYDAFRNSGNGNSNIPLLDPNNEYNTYYSLAIQDVSGGIGKLVEYLYGRNNSDVETSIVNEMKKFSFSSSGALLSGDPGFPDSQKITKGHLDYYLGADTSKYGDVYQYLMKDRDADIIKLAAQNALRAEVKSGAVSGSVTCTPQTVNVSIVLPDGDINSVKAKYAVNAETGIRYIDTDFDNFYGLYDIAFAEDADGKVTMSFKYDILLFRAVNSTGSILYSKADDGSTSVYEYNTTRYADADNEVSNYYIDYSVRTDERYSYADITEASVSTALANNDHPSMVAVFAQRSLRMESVKSNKLDTPVDIYGDPDADNNNTYKIDYINDYGPLAVGDSIEIPLEWFVKYSPNDKIYFAYENGTDFNGFNKQFYDETGNDEDIVTLTDRTITVHPTKQAPINFSVDIQRFYGNTNAIFGSTNKVCEKITLSFSFIGIDPLTFTTGAGNGGTYTVSKESTMRIFAGNGSLNTADLVVLNQKYRSKLVLTELESSNPSVLKVTRDSGSNSEFKVIPQSSGNAVVQFALSIYGQTVVVKLKFNVYGITTIKDEIGLIDINYQYMTKFFSELNRAYTFLGENNISSYNILTADAEHAYYFTDSEGVRINGNPSFVKSVGFVNPGQSKAMLRVEAESELSNSTSEFYLVLRYVPDASNSGFATYAEADEAGAIVLETRQRIKSSKQIVPGTEKNKNPYTDEIDTIYTVWVDVDNIPSANRPSESSATRNDNWYATGDGVDAKVYVPIRCLLELLKDPSGNPLISQPDEYEISRVSVGTGAANYFNCEFRKGGSDVIITPEYNTPVTNTEDGQSVRETYTVTVSVRPRTGGDTQVLAFRIAIDGISTTLDKATYGYIWMFSAIGVFAFLAIIFLIRLIVYWKRRGKQRALIKRNQELIKMRDRIHNKATAATRDQIVKTKLKMEDPKYAKMFNDMRKDKENESGITLENSMLAATADAKVNKKKKKKGGKKSIAELKAELEAKKAAFAQAQSGAPVNPYNDMQGGMDGGFGVQDSGFDATGAFASDIDGETIVFDAPDPNDGNM